MKRIFLSLCLALASISGASAQEAVYYGLSPAVLPPAEDISAHGSGKNGFMAGLVSLDPASDPVLQQLKGRSILGVRCYLREANRYKSKKWSYAMLCKGDPATMERQQFVDFEAGWNDVYFDEPYVIGDDKLYIGLQAYETKGSPYPVVSYNRANVPGGCLLNVAKAGWEEYSDRGILLVQAILPAEAAPLLERAAYARVTTYPLLVEPSKEFACQIYVHNLSGQPLSSLGISTQGAGDGQPYFQTLTFDTPVAAGDSRMVPAFVHAGSAEGVAQDLVLKAVNFNGEEAQAALPGVTSLYVTQDAFTRIPLIEEFTGLTCSNCPFMAYYVDVAMEEYEGPLLYVAHHAGFQDDVFTQPVDKQLIYLFGPEYGPDYKWAYNPAIMYDRTILKGTTVPVQGAKLASEEPYLEAIREAASYPALAEVLVDADKDDAGMLTVTVHGRVHHDLLDGADALYLSTYLVEDGISAEKYPQLGLDTEDAPDDLLERFRHNGVIRHNFSTVATGDVLQPEADATYSVSYPAVKVADGWEWKNCHVVSFVHRFDKDDLSKNSVLNAGGSKFSGGQTGIGSASATTAPVKVYAGADRRIRTSVPVRRTEVYDLRGCRLDAASALLPGVYVVRVTTVSGLHQSQKVVVR